MRLCDSYGHLMLPTASTSIWRIRTYVPAVAAARESEACLFSYGDCWCRERLTAGLVQVHSTAQSPANGVMGTHPIQAPCSVVDSHYRKTAKDTYKAQGGMLTTLDYGVGNVTAALRATGRQWLLVFVADNVRLPLLCACFYYLLLRFISKVYYLCDPPCVRIGWAAATLHKCAAPWWEAYPVGCKL